MPNISEHSKMTDAGFLREGAWADTNNFCFGGANHCRTEPGPQQCEAR